MPSWITKLTEGLADWLRPFIKSDIIELFSAVDQTIGEARGEAVLSPDAWNPEAYALIHAISESVIVPVGGLIISMVLCFEILSLITDRNNMKDIDYLDVIRVILKAAIGALFMANATTIIMAIFALGAFVADSTGGVIGGVTSLAAHQDEINLLVDADLAARGCGELIVMLFEVNLIRLLLRAASFIIWVILCARMIEIYLYASIAPIPFATVTSTRFNIGDHYGKNIFALAFQGFFILLVLGIYSVVIHSYHAAGSLEGQIWSLLGYTLLLALMLLRSGSIARSVFGAGG